MKFVTAKDCKKVISGREVCIFGAYKEGVNVYNTLKSKNNIVCFIDNYRYGGNIEGKDIVSFQQYLDNYRNVPVIIASRRYSIKIAQQLEKEGLKAEIDYWIWDESCLFHETDAMNQFIISNKSVWKNSMKSCHKILTPVIFSHSVSTIVRCSYFSNYFSSVYNAELIGYGFGPIEIENMSTSIKKVYESFNVNKYVDTKLESKYKNEVETIINEIWGNLYTWQ